MAEVAARAATPDAGRCRGRRGRVPGHRLARDVRRAERQPGRPRPRVGGGRAARLRAQPTRPLAAQRLDDGHRDRRPGRRHRLLRARSRARGAAARRRATTPSSPTRTVPPSARRRAGASLRAHRRRPHPGHRGAGPAYLARPRRRLRARRSSTARRASSTPRGRAPTTSAGARRGRAPDRRAGHRLHRLPRRPRRRRSPRAERLDGFRAALARARSRCRPEYVRHERPRLTEPRPPRSRASCWRSSDPPQAILAGADTLAMGVLDAARASGVRVPETSRSSPSTSRPTPT